MQKLIQNVHNALRPLRFIISRRW